MELLRRRVPELAGVATNVRLLKGDSRSMSLIVAFRADGNGYVLKVFQDPAERPLLRTLHRAVCRITRAHTIEGSVEERVRSERTRTEAFRSAGFGTFELKATVWPDTLLYRFHEGMELRYWMNRYGDAAQRLDAVRRLSRDLGRRQTLALAHHGVHLVHPFPRMQHVFLEEGGRWLYFDLEGLLNPALGIDEVLGGEVEDFFFNLLRVTWARDVEHLRAAWDAVGEESIARWEALRRPYFATIHSSIRKRRETLGELRELLQLEPSAGTALTVE